jgi:crotonobetainyl-CoA:carnitine CoA-transferase CaiB-like acyl-CoA transferase
VKGLESSLLGVKVLDFCHLLAGPYASMVLGDLGADVIKVEDPHHPDEGRQIGPLLPHGQTLYFASLNWAKRAAAIDFRSDAGRKAVLDLAATADVVIDNSRPGVMRRFGFDHDALAKVNPKIITCSITAFGDSGPYKERPGYDYTVQAMTGVMSLTGDPDGPPGKAGISYVDHSGGLAAALAVSAALLQRNRTGQGQHLDISLLDVQVSMLSYLAAWTLNAGYAPGRVANGGHPSLVPAQCFESSDGYLSLFVGNDGMWSRFVTAFDDARLQDPSLAQVVDRLARKEFIISMLQEKFRTRPTADWVTLMNDHGVACGPVNDLAAGLIDAQVLDRGGVRRSAHPLYGSYEHVGGPFGAPPGGSSGRAAPLPGEHTSEVFTEIGYSKQELERLLALGVLSN